MAVICLPIVTGWRSVAARHREELDSSVVSVMLTFSELLRYAEFKTYLSRIDFSSHWWHLYTILGLLIKQIRDADSTAVHAVS